VRALLLGAKSGAPRARPWQGHGVALESEIEPTWLAHNQYTCQPAAAVTALTPTPAPNFFWHNSKRRGMCAHRPWTMNTHSTKYNKTATNKTYKVAKGVSTLLLCTNKRTLATHLNANILTRKFIKLDS
jgi:hypothetical protein